MIPELAYIRVTRNQIKYYRPFRLKTIQVSNLSEVNYHYHAVVGFTAVWEFLEMNGKSTEVGAQTIGINKTLSYLEKNLPGFEIKNFKKLFEDGDVVDTLNVWKNISKRWS